MRRGKTAIGRFRGLVIGALAVIVVLAIWHLLTAVTGTFSTLTLPSPQQVGSRFSSLLSNPYLGETLVGHTRASLKIVLLGWAFGGLIGGTLGILMGWNRWVRAVVGPVFQLVRPISPIAWIPLAIVWFGLGDASRIYVVWIAAFVPWVINSFEAVRSIDPILVSAATTLGANQRTVLLRIVLPTSLPMLLAGARISLGNAWMTLIAAELLGVSSGLGYMALNAQRTLDSDILLVAMAVMGLLGAAFSVLMLMLERQVCRWDNRGAAT